MTHLHLWIRRAVWLALGITILLNGLIAGGAPVSAHPHIQASHTLRHCVQESGRLSSLASESSPAPDITYTAQASPSPEATPTTGWQDCGSQGAAILFLSIKGCQKVPCIFQRGTDAAITARFRSLIDTDVATLVVHASIGIFSVELKVPESNACKSMIKPSCPLSSGQEYTIGGSVPVLKDYPALNGTIT